MALVEYARDFIPNVYSFIIGANAHAILDDAYHYLHQHGLDGYHHCAKIPSLNDTPALNGATHAIKTERNGSATENGAAAAADAGPKLLVWSAADAAAAQRMVGAYRDYFGAHVAGDAAKLEQLAHTLAARRSVLSWRAFAVADVETDELSAAKPVRASSSPTADGIAFVFTGQGAQYAGMGLGLLRYAVFESSLKRSDEILANLGCEWSLFGQSCLESSFPEHSLLRFFMLKF